ncbi:L-lysine 6-transaminase [Rubricoccus marinus]|uniref:L-lysine-epsilon aminotransferase n=1 Tax=Rubricoccus marinus TaxID=716817 RepID=A0A259U0C5_9BACT|nr:L-lysine 6-transaminase [Rubricoccus marinus]OZC03475.1 L-lysine 6-transaminase [Rubricoccus marinus]
MQVLDTPPKALPSATDVRDILGRHILADGYNMVLDMDQSQGIYLRDAVTGKDYVDLFTFYASNPLGMNHPGLAGPSPEAQAFRARLMDAAVNKVANSDIYTPHYARFVQTFERVGIPAELPHAFFVSGGALAIENALKVAFDWKVRKNIAAGRGEIGSQVMHFQQAFHGRSGYTMSLTNTDPNKVRYFPKFDWPRISNPVIRYGEDVEAREAQAIAEAEAAFAANPHDIAAIIIEPIQGEGGDNHFRPAFFQALRTLADEHEALLVFDEVQTGVGLTGTMWAWQGIGVQPDIMAFGKKSQVCGILASRRIDEVEDNVFEKSSRINSTWGGNLVDMVRFDRFLEVIEEHDLVGNAWRQGEHLLGRLRAMEERFESVTHARGRGLMCAFDLASGDERDAVAKRAYEHGAIVLGCGERSIRFRPALTIDRDGLDEGLAILERSLTDVLEA